MGKRVVFVAAIVAAATATFFSTLDKNLFNLGQSLGTYLAPPAATVFLVGILWKKATPKAAELTLYIGTALCLSFGFCQLIGFPSTSFWPHYMLLCFYMMVVLVIFMLLVSLATQSSIANNVADETQSSDLLIKIPKTDKMIKLLWVVIAVIMLLIYYIFN
jgi:SSS family solute:Na+ symporter